MDLVWNNPRPNRTVDRPLGWEIVRRNGTRRVLPDPGIQAISDCKDHGVKDAGAPVATGVLGFCF